MKNTPIQSQGFTLTELAVVMVIVALLIGGLVVPLSAQTDLRNSQDTQARLNEVRDALIGYAIVNGNFPCPAPVDLSTNGAEARTGNTCTSGARVGLVPWQTLGLVMPTDAWGHYFRYSVSAAFSDSGTKFSLASAGDITVSTRNAAGALIPLASTIPVAVVSAGNNASWAYNQSGERVADASATNVDEDTNGNGDGTQFVSRTQSNEPSNGGEFDDMVTWVSPNVLFNRMITAGKLP